jgi:hypothetical protein
MGQIRPIVGIACFIFASLSLAGCDQSPAMVGDHDLDLAQYRRTFLEDFEHFDISGWGPGTRWIAHTPWHGDFGDAVFTDPGPGFPFQTASSILRIEARKGADGHWSSGLIASWDHPGRDGHGFAQQYGYFEIETKLPPGPGVWPAFWLFGVDPKPGAEIDVLEYYGNANASYHANVHTWVDGQQTFGDGTVVQIPPDSATSGFNRYGVRIDHDWVTFFFNRHEVWRTPTRPEYRQPLYILANLALGSGWPIDKTPNPSFMYIKSIAAYEKRA